MALTGTLLEAGMEMTSSVQPWTFTLTCFIITNQRAFILLSADYSVTYTQTLTYRLVSSLSQTDVC